MLDVYARARVDELLVVRLKAGDPALFGALDPELAAVRGLGLDHEIVPGVSALGAAAAALGCEVALPGAPLLLIGADDPEGRGCAVPGVAAFMAGRDPAGLASALANRGLPRETPCAIVVDVSRPSEILMTGRLDELAELAEDAGRSGSMLVLAGRAVGSLPAP